LSSAAKKKVYLFKLQVNTEKRVAKFVELNESTLILGEIATYDDPSSERSIDAFVPKNISTQRQNSNLNFTIYQKYLNITNEGKLIFGLFSRVVEKAKSSLNRVT